MPKHAILYHPAADPDGVSVLIVKARDVDAALDKAGRVVGRSNIIGHGKLTRADKWEGGGYDYAHPRRVNSKPHVTKERYK